MVSEQKKMVIFLRSCKTISLSRTIKIFFLWVEGEVLNKEVG